MLPIVAAAGLSALGSAVGSAISGYSTYEAQREANVANVQSAREQMAFQERMSNTSWQRGVEDMKKAGINPMLAFSKGGAPVPGGAQANLQPARRDYGGAITSASQVLQNELNNQLLLAQIASTAKDAKRKDVETKILINDLRKSNQETDIDTSTFGKIISYINRVAPLATTAVGLGSKAAHLFRGSDWRSIGRGSQIFNPRTGEVR